MAAGGKLSPDTVAANGSDRRLPPDFLAANGSQQRQPVKHAPPGWLPLAAKTPDRPDRASQRVSIGSQLRRPLERDPPGWRPPAGGAMTRIAGPRPRDNGRMSNGPRTIADDPAVKAAKQIYVIERRRRALSPRPAFDRLVGACAWAAARQGLRVGARKDFDTEDYEQLGQRPSEFVREADGVFESLPADAPRQSLAARATAISRSLQRLRKNDPCFPGADRDTVVPVGGRFGFCLKKRAPGERQRN